VPWRALFIGIVGVAIIAGVGWALLGSSLLVVRRIEVTGNTGLPAARVRAASGIQPGTPLARLDAAAAVRRVERLSRVLSAQVGRSWPDTVVITVRVRRAALTVASGVDMPRMALDSLRGRPLPEHADFRELDWNSLAVEVARLRDEKQQLESASDVLAQLTARLSEVSAALKSTDDAFAAWGGISGCQTLLALLLSEGHRARGLDLDLIARITAGYVARRFRLHRKGRLEPGADADLVLVDLTTPEQLSAEALQYRHRHSPFVGRTLRARIARTLVRGRTVFADGRIVGPPAGRLLIPESETETP